MIMTFKIVTVGLVVSCALVAAAFGGNLTTNLVSYYGQNSLGVPGGQQDLSFYCQGGCHRNI